MRQSKSRTFRLWPLLAVNFFMADMQSGIGPFVGVFLAQRGWDSGLIGTALTIGNIAGMLITTPIGGFIDTSNHKRPWARALRSFCYGKISGPLPLRKWRPRSPALRSFPR